MHFLVLDLVELNSGVTISSDGPYLGSMLLMRTILKGDHELRRTQNERLSVIVLKPVVCKIWAINECEDLQVMLRYV